MSKADELYCEIYNRREPILQKLDRKNTERVLARFKRSLNFVQHFPYDKYDLIKYGETIVSESWLRTTDYLNTQGFTCIYSRRRREIRV